MPNSIPDHGNNRTIVRRRRRSSHFRRNRWSDWIRRLSILVFLLVILCQLVLVGIWMKYSVNDLLDPFHDNHSLGGGPNVENSLSLFKKLDDSKDSVVVETTHTDWNTSIIILGDDQTTTSTVLNQNKYLIFRHVHTGQGTGNILSGLLAAQLLGEEFNRTVCVEYKSFHLAFGSTKQRHDEWCQTVQSQMPPTLNNTIVQKNYDKTSYGSECDLQSLLNSDTKVLYYTGNTYPHWPTRKFPMQNQSPIDHFHQYYQPTQALQTVLPWKNASAPPEVVVHLRQPDGDLDARPGLDNVTLAALGTQLQPFLFNHSSSSSSIYLVTNRVEWYDYFAKNFGWSHPPWYSVQHSALRIVWGFRQHATANTDNTTTTTTSAEEKALLLQTSQQEKRRQLKQRQSLQMWADWYTLLNAKTMYHTASDFSGSAARWNEHIVSWTIQGITAQEEVVAVSTNHKDNMTDETNHHNVVLKLTRDFAFQENTPSSPSATTTFYRPLVARRGDDLKYCLHQANQQDDFLKEYRESKLHLTLALARQRRESSPMDSGLSKAFARANISSLGN